MKDSIEAKLHSIGVDPARKTFQDPVLQSKYEELRKPSRKFALPSQGPIDHPRKRQKLDSADENRTSAEGISKRLISRLYKTLGNQDVSDLGGLSAVALSVFQD